MTHWSRIEQQMDLDDPDFVHDHFLLLSVDLFLRLQITAKFDLSLPTFRYQLENPAFKLLPT